ncbi:MAG TPA: hypothetical protein VIY29_30565 [Ktedonobacteraceae bacterium]
MGCTELRRLLMHTDWRENERASSCIASHIRTCPHCHHGLVHLSKAIIRDDLLSCEQSRARFPDYYEATRPEYPLVEMTNDEMAQMAYHLSHCAACHREYEELVLLSELEERNEMLDL